jgi:hypothetical protein
MSAEVIVKAPRLFGLAVEFDTPEALLAACRQVAAAGYVEVETYTPYALAEIGDILHFGRSKMAPIVGTGAIIGACTGFSIQYFANVIHYPWNIGGKPPNSWPMWVPITFELAILLGAVFGVVGMLLINHLPRLHHPMFGLDAFARASRDRFFLCIEADDPKFDLTETRRLLESTQPLSILEVPR